MRRDFLVSPHHAALAAATLGAGFATGEPLYLLLGGAAYVLGWVYLPDLKFFRDWVEAKRQAKLAAEEAGELRDFHSKRDAALSALTTSRRQRYQALADVCRQVEQAIGATDDPRVRKLEEMMWTYLRLLTTGQSLERFLELESRENLPGLVRNASAEVERLEQEIADLKANGSDAIADTKERLLQTRRDLLEALNQRTERVEQARHHLDLLHAEEERLEQQIKLLRADAMATANTTAISARIDAAVEQLSTTNTWLREMDQFRSAITEPPLPAQRVGFGTQQVPPPIPAGRVKGKQ